jgi:hypothetical protein
MVWVPFWLRVVVQSPCKACPWGFLEWLGKICTERKGAEGPTTAIRRW